MQETRSKEYIRYKRYYDEYSEMERRRKYESNKDALNKEYEKLPDFFKKQIDQFRIDDPEFWEKESYEIFVFGEAMKIVNALKTINAVYESWEKGFKEQKRLVPDLSSRHSGHSWGCANRCAIKYLKYQLN